METTNAQRKAYQQLKADGSLSDAESYLATHTEVYIYHAPVGGKRKVTAIHVSGLVTEHYQTHSE